MPEPLTPQEESEIRARLERPFNAETYREDISRLLETIAVLREENERLKKLVKDGSY